MKSTIMVETSAHHLHVTAETFATLFGEGKTLTNKKDLSQPGQFACVEKVTVVGPKGEITQTMHPDMIIEQEGKKDSAEDVADMLYDLYSYERRQAKAVME